MTTFVEHLERAGLMGRPDLHVLPWHDTRGITWEQIVLRSSIKCREVGAELLIVDTLPQFAGLRGDSENNSGDALRVMEPLRRGTAKGELAVITTRHDRKGGGQVGDSGRGSSAFVGAVDIVVAMRRPEGKVRPTLRVLHALSRFRLTPPSLTIDLTPNGYVALGSEGTAAIVEAKRALIANLPASKTPALSLDEIQKSLGFARTVLQDALIELVGVKEVERIGGGKKGSPYRYFRPVAVSAGT
jgi:hypothetical protein